MKAEGTPKERHQDVANMIQAEIYKNYSEIEPKERRLEYVRLIDIYCKKFGLSRARLIKLLM